VIVGRALARAGHGSENAAGDLLPFGESGGLPLAAGLLRAAPLERRAGLSPVP